ncbi:DUF4306 domain-containing protein [Solibacillus sp. CAU 1738]
MITHFHNKECSKIYKLIVQLLAVTLFFIVSAAIALYEGSALVNKPWEWRYSTPFSKFFGIEIQQGSDILLLDYFVYALKFQPLFPLIMVLCVIYALILLGFILFKNISHVIPIYFGSLGLIAIVFSLFLLGASTTGGNYMFYLLVTAGVLLLVFALYSRFTNRNSVKEST